jgi:hypothetical protein
LKETPLEYKKKHPQQHFHDGKMQAQGDPLRKVN